jgi:flagellar protein FliS
MTYTAEAARSRYVGDQLETASGTRIILLCFDRLDRDLAQAGSAIERSDQGAANSALAHAQDLLSELATMLDVQAWEHAGALLSIYDYLLRLLPVANATKSAALVREAAGIVNEIGAAFRIAADTPADATATGLSDPASSDGAPRRFSFEA